MKKETVGNYVVKRFCENEWKWLYKAASSAEQNRKLELLSNILFESDLSSVEELNDRIFEFGSLIGEKDYLERQLFVYMVMMLHAYQAEESLNQR